MRDPVTGFEYPVEWVNRCTSPELLSLVDQGLCILTASGTILRRGFTTGTTAAAASKAAILSLTGMVNSVPVRIPCGLVVDVPVSGFAGTASCKKYAGDYPDDVTAGILFIAEASPLSDGIHFIPGEGIGRFSRDTPRFRKGDPAITPAPLECILTSIQEALDETGLCGVEVTLHVPAGKEIAKKTLNPRVGVDDGISVLGTTGLVEPWDDHLESSIIELVTAAKRPVFTSGRIGMRYARLLYPDRDVILVGGKIKEALAAARGDVILCGLPALILRYINPHILEGTGFKTVEEFTVSDEFGRVAQTTIAAFGKTNPSVHVVLVDRAGRIIGESQ